ncbi:MAG: beta galactosidase jelly roll domain-containing protein [Clostridia bacterium]|nr:beta galactosidase jelly roll domain-containing protein [Clostridia bacterium]
MAAIPRSEHPQPDRLRKNWLSLNGSWRFAFDEENVGKKEAWYREKKYPHEIQVPFAYQSKLSGIDDQRHCDVIWYERDFALPENLRSLRRLLHFGAVDYRADVWLDGQYLGSHEGGYTPFSFDITDLTADKNYCRLTVRCEDRLDFDQPRGKQSYRPEPFACWYTPVSGIWQSVWLEGVGEYYPVDFRLTPHIETGSVKVEAELNAVPPRGKLRLTARYKDKATAQQEVTITSDRFIQTELYMNHDETLEGIHMWRPGNPALYDLTLETLSGENVCDAVDTYFGFRRIDVSGGHVMLNNDVFFQRLILDQGYWPDGLLTAPSDEALKKDVELTLTMGYNGARKHQKFEDPRYLYWADHLGLAVWSELPSAYWLRDSEKRNMIRDLSEAIKRDYNHPCIITWTPLNESWGVPYIRFQKEAQRLADALYHLIYTLDGTRLVSGNDGWEMASTDLVTIHDYTARPEDLSRNYQDREALLRGAVQPGSMISAEGYDHRGKPMLLTEYGGIAMAKDTGGGSWGYSEAEKDEKSFLARFEAITQAFKHMPGFQGYCYTQLTDVFQEVNGLMDMERRPKVSIEAIRQINLKR